MNNESRATVDGSARTTVRIDPSRAETSWRWEQRRRDVASTAVRRRVSL